MTTYKKLRTALIRLTGSSCLSLMKIRLLHHADEVLLGCKLLTLTLTFKNFKIRKVKLVSLKKEALLIHSLSETLLLKLQNSRTNY